MRSGPLSDKTAQDAVDISNISYGALNGAFWCMVGHSGAQSDKSSPETVEKTTHNPSLAHLQCEALRGMFCTHMFNVHCVLQCIYKVSERTLLKG